MKDIREVIAKNICELRTENGLTQLKLAEALNYSDKAVSKWERAESVPDVAVLKQLADYFGVTVDYIVSEVHTADQIKNKNVSVSRRRNRLLITLLAISLVWLVATFAFVEINILIEDPFLPSWLMFIYAIPASAVVALVFNSIWGYGRMNFIIITVLIWTVILSFYLSFLMGPHLNFWLLFMIGIPAEFIVFLWAGLVFKKRDKQE